MTEPLDLLRQVIATETARLRASIPADRERAVSALLGVRDAVAPPLDPVPDPVAGVRMTDPGGNRALHLVLTTEGTGAVVPGWAEAFLARCDALAEAETVSAQTVSGQMGGGTTRLEFDRAGKLHAWLVGRRMPTAWRERADHAWWGRWLADRLGPLTSPAAPDALVARMAHQLPFPPDAVIGVLPLRTWAAIVVRLYAAEAFHVKHMADLVADIARDDGLAPDLAAEAMSALTLTSDSASYHASVPGIAAPPLVRIDAERVVASRRGLMQEPLLFLARELRRRDPNAWHTAAHAREDAFRADLADLFRAGRFVVSPARIMLRREGNSARTDIDAAVFDRRSGTLGLFELKSLDPFARSGAEAARRQDNLRQAGRQVAGVLDWLNRHGADEVLRRMDAVVARRFRVQRVCPFVLSRLTPLAGDPPDRRVAWGTWPQVLRLLGDEAGASSNPIQSLFTRLQGDSATIPKMSSREIVIGDNRLLVHPTAAAFRVWNGSSEAQVP